MAYGSSVDSHSSRWQRIIYRMADARFRSVASQYRASRSRSRGVISIAGRPTIARSGGGAAASRGMDGFAIA